MQRMQGRVRAPAVAGLFYPAERPALEALVRRQLADAKGGVGDPPKAVVLPHAGYVYSGPVAASGYARLAPLRGRVRRVVLLGPAHRVYVRSIAAPTATAFATPLGSVPVDRDAVESVAALPQVTLSDEPHAPEHSLEVHLPFLQVVLGDFSLVPLVVGDATPEEVAEVIEHLWGGPETLVVVSSDLSHYEEYGVARELDEATSRAIEALDGSAIGHDQACGRRPLQGLLQVARRHGLAARTVDLRSSGDTAGSRDAVVGYGAYVFG